MQQQFEAVVESEPIRRVIQAHLLCLTVWLALREEGCRELCQRDVEVR